MSWRTFPYLVKTIFGLGHHDDHDDCNDDNYDDDDDDDNDDNDDNIFASVENYLQPWAR